MSKTKAPKVLIIGASGTVGKATSVMCTQEGFKKIILVGRTEKTLQETKELCIQKSTLFSTPKENIHICVIDMSKNLDVLQDVLITHDINVVIDVGLPYYNKEIMQVCLNTSTNYVNTACQESIDAENGGTFNNLGEMSLDGEFQHKNISGLIGMGTCPGFSNVMVNAMAFDKELEVDKIEIFDANDCTKPGYFFSTNFNAKANLQELEANAKWYDRGTWVEKPCFDSSNKLSEELPSVGVQQFYTVYHEEVDDIRKRFPNSIVKYNMSFDDSYVNTFMVMKNLGLLSNKKTESGISPIEFLDQFVLPRPEETAKVMSGITEVMVKVTFKDGTSRVMWNNLDHQECFTKFGTQGIGTNTAVGALSAALLILDGMTPGVYNGSTITKQEDIRRLFEYSASLGMPHHTL